MCMKSTDVNRSSFKYNFLKQIILRLDFQGVLPTEMEGILSKIKPFLKDKSFNRYEQRVESEIEIPMGVFQASNEQPMPSVHNINIHCFIDENKGYSVDLSTNFICMKVNAAKYIPFDDYADTFIGLASIYRETIDFLTVKRFGLRKINFCFLKKIESLNTYFNPQFFSSFNLFENTEVLANEKKENFKTDNCNINLMCSVNQGQLGGNIIYKVSLDSDIYIDNAKDIETIIFESKHIANLNDKLFSIYLETITDEFGKMLANSETEWSDEIIGVEKNE